MHFLLKVRFSRKSLSKEGLKGKGLSDSPFFFVAKYSKNTLLTAQQVIAYDKASNDKNQRGQRNRNKENGDHSAAEGKQHQSINPFQKESPLLVYL